MKLSKNKKGFAFETINAGMISFLSFMLITLLVIMMTTVVGNTSIVSSDVNATAAMGHLRSAAALPSQFAQIIVIVVIIVGILGMLSMVGYGAYQKLQK